MKKSAIRFLSVLMAVILGITSGNIGAYATTLSGNDISAEKSEGQHVEISENELEVEGTNSFGKMFAEALEEKNCEQQENNGYNIFSIEMNGKNASVELDAVEDCTLIVGIYDESGEKLMAAGATTVTAGSEKASLAVDIAPENMPAYFYLRGFLVDTYTCRPLCTVYESPNYTREMQEFLAKTTSDFAPDRVLNFDSALDNNFAVYEDDVVVVEENGTSNQFTGIDEVAQKYVVENADTSVTALAPGDIFVYEEADEVLIIKVAHVDVSGTTATIYGSEASMEEVFSYIKIDATSDTEDVEVDTTDCDEGVEYAGKVEMVDEETYATESAETGDEMQEEVEGEGSTSTKLKYNFLDKSALKGSVELKLNVSLKFFLTQSYKYLEVKIKYTLGVDISLSDKADCSFKLGELKQMPFFGVVVKEKVCFIIECNAKFSVKGTLSGQIGAKIANDGVSDLSSAPKFKTELKGEVSLFIGLGFDPEVKVISEHVADAKLETRVGVEATAGLAPSENSQSEHHDCSVCVDGEINFKASASFSAKLFSKWKYTYDIAEFKIKISDWYYSTNLNKFGWGECPNRSYRVDISVLDENGNAINGAKVDAKGSNDNLSLTTVNGKTHSYLKMGSHEIAVQANGYNSVCQKVKIEEKPRSVVVNLKKIGSSGENSGNGLGGSFGKIVSVSSGYTHSGAITEDGSLYMWGQNDYGQIGNGTKEICLRPTKILENVKSVSLGKSHSGAITEDGSLYMWGNSFYGQVGHGKRSNCSEPIKILNNVKSISIGYTCGAITEDGSLYMWGYNDCGIIGNGKYPFKDDYYVCTPTKILDHVKSVSIGGYHSGAITEDGSLYMWGDNTYGQIGNGTREICLKPTKILENVKSVSLGGYYSGAITEDGSLYMWGNNSYCQLGTGTEASCSEPTKILDHVKSVSFGNNSCGAITEDGSLYMWGASFYGQAGTGTEACCSEPTKILDHVKRVSIGAICNAITEDESLYMWGWNSYGQVGNGTTSNCLKPTKILDHVKSESIGAICNAITEDGSLYMWGQNDYGQIGNGTKEICLRPTKILENVKSVSLGKSHSGAITEDGSLYMWGWNLYGQIGNGTTTNSSIPVKITIPLQTESSEIYTESTIDDSNVKKVSTQSGTLSFSGLMPNTTYNFYIMKSKDKVDVWEADNLLYIKQVNSDSSGNVAASYYSTDAYENADAFLVSAKQTDLSNATVNVSNLTYNGQDQFVKVTVTLNGKTLKEGRDFDLEGEYFAKNVGNYTVSIKGIGMYCGTKKVTYSVLQKESNKDDENNNNNNNTNDSNNSNTNNSNNNNANTSTDNAKTQIESFVKRMYTVALSRDAETKGLNDWSGQLSNQEIDGAGIANGFINSVEFKNRNLNNNDYLDVLYRTFFDREADAGGKAYWMDKLQKGISRTEVLSGFVNSQEFSNLCDRFGIARGTMQADGSSIYRSGVRGYVLRMYTKALNRDGETVGVEDWTNRINTKVMSPEAVAKSFFSSQEFINRNLSNADYVETLYQTFMDRASDEGGKQYWINQLNSGMSRQQVLEGFSRSEEFSKIMKRYGL